MAFFVGAYLGSHLAIRIEHELLKKLFAIILLFTAFKLLGWDKLIVKWIKSLY